jgi:hypothetical protein
MPASKLSKKQKKLFRAVEHSASFAKEVGIQQSVAREMLHGKKKKKKK